MPRYVVQDFDLRVRRSKTGKGLYTNSTIPKGACILEYTGRVATPAEIEEDTGKYLFWLTDTEMINGNIPSNTARFINHSCAPNCESAGPRTRIFIVALRTIRPGEELTYDYGEEYFNRHINPKGCRCTKCTSNDKYILINSNH